jgi:hypothetical protein
LCVGVDSVDDNPSPKDQLIAVIVVLAGDMFARDNAISAGACAEVTAVPFNFATISAVIEGAGIYLISFPE